MAYDVRYYRDRAMRRPMPDMDSDISLNRYPAPTGREVAHAVGKNGVPDRYGYDGEWHDKPPAEAR